MLVTQSCLTLWDPIDCSSPGSSVRGILQARILEWIAIPFSKYSQNFFKKGLMGTIPLSFCKFSMFVFSLYTIKTIYLNIKSLTSYFPWKSWKMLSYTILLQGWPKSYAYFPLDKWCNFFAFLLVMLCYPRIISFIFQV